MKFEMPIMNISMFEMENVATIASTATNLDAANAYVEGLKDKAAAEGRTIATINVAF